MYHIAEVDAWQEAQQKGEYLPAGFSAEGFIHCSFSWQVIPVANRFYHGRTGLILLEIDPALLKAEVRLENLEGGAELFPHIYGALNLEAVRQAVDFSARPDGSFEFFIGSDFG